MKKAELSLTGRADKQKDIMLSSNSESFNEATRTWSNTVQNTFSWQGDPGGFDWKKPAGADSEYGYQLSRFFLAGPLVLGRFQECVYRLEDGLPCWDWAGLPDRKAGILNDLGITYAMVGRYDDAIAALENALVITERTGRRDREAYVRNNRVHVYYRQGRHEEAVDEARHALAMTEDLGNTGGLGIAHDTLADSYRARPAARGRRGVPARDRTPARSPPPRPRRGGGLPRAAGPGHAGTDQEPAVTIRTA